MVTMYIKHLAESAIFELITSDNIFSHFEKQCNKCQMFHIRDVVVHSPHQRIRLNSQANDK